MTSGLAYDRLEVPWGDLQPQQYVVTRDGELWRLLENRDGAWLVENNRHKVIWAAQDPKRLVSVARLHPVDPLHLLRENLNATPIAFKRNDEDVWIAAPWHAEKPGNESIEIYRAHMAEMHGLKPQPGLSYEELRAFHTEHHTEGIAHTTPHTHPEGR